MSNPCINRWGLNSFWHHYWYSDSRYYQNVQHDNLVLELLTTYLNYGTDVSSPLFLDSFWYKTATKLQPQNLNRYYRWATVYNDTLRTTSTYRLREESEETFRTRINILKFSSWFVVNVYWFQPDKDKLKRSRRAKIRRKTSVVSGSYTSKSYVTKFNSALKLVGGTASYPQVSGYEF